MEYKNLIKEIEKICKWQLECSITNDNTNGYYEILDKISEVLNENSLV